MTKLVEKIILFSLIIFFLQSVAYFLIHHVDHEPIEVSILKDYLNKNTEVIYLSDSTATSFSFKDQDKSSIQKILANDLQDYQIGAVTHPAYMMDTFEKYLEYITEHNKNVKMIILTINLRSFSKEIEENPMNEFRKLKFYLDYPSLLLNIFYQPMAAFKVYEVGESNVSAHFSDTMVQQLRLRYLYDLNPNQKGVKAMVKIKNYLAKSNIKALFYITPIDYQVASLYMGNEFEQKVSQNIFKIKKTLDQQNIYVLDLSFSLSHQLFHWPGIYMNEHLTEDGRKFVAQQLGSFVKSNLSKN